MNNKGYLLVEIIVASVIAMSMMYFLLEITIKLKNINEDYYVETKLETDQILMLKDVMEDLSNNTLKKVEVSGSNVIFDFIDKNNNEFTTKISISIEDNTYKYGKLNTLLTYEDDVYVKKLDNNLNLGQLTIKNLCYQDNIYKDCSNDNTSKGLLKINIPATTIYSDADYGIKLVIPYNTKEITIKNKANYFYYTSHVDDRYNSRTVFVYACDNSKCDNEGNCNCKNTDVDSAFLFGSPGQYAAFTLTPDVVANNSNLYFTKYTSTYDSATITIYKCELDGSNCKSIKTITGSDVPSAISELSTKLLVNDKNLFYTQYYDPYWRESKKYMNIYKCDLNGENCVKVGANPDVGAVTQITNTTYPIATTGGSIKVRFALNDEHLYYTSYYGDYDDRLYMTIYICDLEGSNCKVLGNNARTARLAIGNTYNHFSPEIVATNKYFYYTSYNGSYDTSQMAMYRCDKDGENCVFIGNSGVSSGTNFGGAFNVQISANEDYFYYTNNYYIYRDGFYNDVYVCDAEGNSSSCKRVSSNIGCYQEAHSSIYTRIDSSDTNLYYTSCYSSRDEGVSMLMYKCETNGNNCKNVGSGSAITGFSSCGSSGTSTICNNMAFGNQNPLIVAIR